jgi:hypothetical protein
LRTEGVAISLCSDLTGAESASIAAPVLPMEDGSAFVAPATGEDFGADMPIEMDGEKSASLDFTAFFVQLMKTANNTTNRNTMRQRTTDFFLFSDILRSPLVYFLRQILLIALLEISDS